MGDAVVLHNSCFGPEGALQGLGLCSGSSLMPAVFNIGLTQGALPCAHPDPKNDLAS